jgi:hypothetical protein
MVLQEERESFGKHPSLGQSKFLMLFSFKKERGRG